MSVNYNSRRGEIIIVVDHGIVIGHELVGEIKELGHGVEGFEVGERVVVCADSPCGQCNDE